MERPPEEITTLETQETLHTPFYEVTLKEFGEQFPAQKEALRTVLDEIDEQGIKNFDIFHSENMPGVSFSYSKLTVTPELIKRLAGKNIDALASVDTQNASEETEEEGQEENTNSKRHDYFLFTAFSPPPDGHAFTVEDVAIDRFVRLLPRVAGALKRGETPPEVNVYMLGAPTGFGGAVTTEWIEKIKHEGLEGHGKLYAEFVEKHEPPENRDAHIVLQGVSKGAIVAEKTSKYLPEHLQESTQRLLDNPAGDHEGSRLRRWVKGAQVAAGLGAETLARIVFDDTMKELMKQGGPFVSKLSEKTGMPKDNSEQSKLKQSAVLAEGLALLKGTSLDTDETRSFIRRGVYDPLTFSPKRLLEIHKKQKENSGSIPFFQKGKSLEVPFKGAHFFLYNRFKRWSKILGYSQNV